MTLRAGFDADISQARHLSVTGLLGTAYPLAWGVSPPAQRADCST